MGATGETPEDYLLGSNEAEWRRLGLQHELWKEPTDRLFARAGFGPGQRLLDLGCGPGFTTRDLARLAGPTGEVVGRDLDPKGLQHLDRLAAEEKPLVMRGEAADATADLRALGPLDGIFARWLLCWLPDVPQVLARCAEALLPGGRLAVFDYLHYGALDLLPQDPGFRRGIDAVQERWRASGGDPDVGNRLPRLCREAGLQVTHQEVLVQGVRPDQPLWRWPTTFFPGFMAKLVVDGILTPEEAAAFDAAWRRAEDDPDGLFLTPPLMLLVARRA